MKGRLTVHCKHGVFTGKVEELSGENLNSLKELFEGMSRTRLLKIYTDTGYLVFTEDVIADMVIRFETVEDD